VCMHRLSQCDPEASSGQQECECSHNQDQRNALTVDPDNLGIRSMMVFGHLAPSRCHTL
jgi:hypothetical protein